MVFIISKNHSIFNDLNRTAASWYETENYRNNCITKCININYYKHFLPTWTTIEFWWMGRRLRVKAKNMKRNKKYSFDWSISNAIYCVKRANFSRLEEKANFTGAKNGEIFLRGCSLNCACVRALSTNQL